MQAAAAPPAQPPPPPPRRRRRVYRSVDPRCEWTSTEDADTLVVDVSGFRREELKVLYNTRRKLKVAGERQVDGGGHQWARFLKVFPVPGSCDASAIRAKMYVEDGQLLVILPKGSAAKGKQEEHRPQEKKGTADGPSAGSSSGSFWSAPDDAAGKGKVEEKEQRGDRQGLEEPRRQDQAIPTQELPGRDNGDDENAVKKDSGGDTMKDDDGDEGKGEDGRWWKKITVLHVLGFVLVLALVGVGATLMYVVLL